MFAYSSTYFILELCHYAYVFRVTWGIYTLIYTQGKESIQVVLILQLKGAAGFQKQSTNFLYVKGY